MKCKSGVLTQDGSKSSSMKDPNSLIGRMDLLLMSRIAKTRKDKLLVFKIIQETLTRDGRLSILTRLKRLRLRA